MLVTVGKYDKGLEHIGERLKTLGLDIKLATFGKNGKYRIDGTEVAPADAAIDYLWLNSNINLDNFQAGAFDIALATKSIGVLQTFNAGLDHPFYKKIAAKGTRICNSSAQGVAIAEYVMAQVLSVVHPIQQQRDLQAAKQWKVTPFRELSQMNWLIAGFGPIGQEVATRVKAFGTTTSVIRRSPSPSPVADKVGTMADLKAFLPVADVIILACSLNAETRGMADAAFFALVKEGAILVNIARGALIDDDALIAALDKGRLATAILDVFHEEPLPPANALWSHPRVRVTSHTSFAGSGVRGRWDRLFLDNIGRFVKGEKLVSEVNPGDLA
jgi:phosphoglycerate dehydrogenase-like enzyme